MHAVSQDQAIGLYPGERVSVRGIVTRDGILVSGGDDAIRRVGGRDGGPPRRPDGAGGGADPGPDPKPDPHADPRPEPRVLKVAIILVTFDDSLWSDPSPAAAKAAEDQIVSTLVDPRYPVNGVALLPDTSTAKSPSAQPPFRQSAVSATVSDWRPGAMTVALQGTEPVLSQLLVSENWYPDLRAEVDGKPGVVRRMDHTLLGVDLPAGAREVRLIFDSSAYARGKIVSALSLLTAVCMIVLPLFRQRHVGKQETPSAVMA